MCLQSMLLLKEDIYMRNPNVREVTLSSNFAISLPTDNYPVLNKAEHIIPLTTN